jgi:hypothetical protein
VQVPELASPVIFSSWGVLKLGFLKNPESILAGYACIGTNYLIITSAFGKNPEPRN